jgi:hypothetical protein
VAQLEPHILTDIRSEAGRLLHKADAIEVLPTPVEQLVEAAELAQSDEWLLDESLLAKASAEVRSILRGVGRKLRGTLDRRERVIYVDPDLSTARARFVKLHETTHEVLPWQRDLHLFADNDVTLSETVERQMEQEANQGAAELLFQLDYFSRIARDYPTKLSTPVELSTMFGASIHASIRRWVEGHDHAISVLVLEGAPSSNDPLTYRMRYQIQSPAWRQVFGPSTFGRTVSAATMPFLGTITGPMVWDAESTWQFPGRDGEMRSLLVEGFTNTYDQFVMLRVPQRDRLVARHRRPATIVVPR